MRTMQGSTTTQVLSVERVIAYLQSREDTFAVSRGDEDDFEGKEADLVWYWVDVHNSTKPLPCLVVGDRFNRGLFQFTTTEDADAKLFSPFIESQCVYLFYYFLTSGELFIGALPKLREWFMLNIDSFEPRRNAVKVEPDGYRIELVRLVPIEMALENDVMKLIGTC
jgi:hypothetical protein